MTALGIALTVAVLLAILALVNGLRATLSTSGDPLHVLVLRKGSTSELVSNFLRTQLSGPEVQARHRHAARTASRWLRWKWSPSSISRPPKGRRARTSRCAACRPRASKCGATSSRQRPVVRFQDGRRELVVGKPSPSAIPERGIGKKIRFGRGDWDVVGVIDAGHGAQDSEIWGDLNQISADLQRLDVLSSALVRSHRPGGRRGADQRHQ